MAEIVFFPKKHLSAEELADGILQGIERTTPFATLEIRSLMRQALIDEASPFMTFPTGLFDFLSVAGLDAQRQQEICGEAQRIAVAYAKDVVVPVLGKLLARRFTIERARYVLTDMT